MMGHHILVLGATGNVGGHLTRKLVKEGYAVKTASRSGALSVEGAKGVLFDLADPATFSSALEGVGSAFVIMPADYNGVAHLMTPFLQALAERQIKIVYLSGMGLESYKQSSHREIESWLETSGANFVILRANWFMDNFHTFWYDGIVNKGQVTVPTADHKMSLIDARDIADVAAKVITSNTWDMANLVLTGPESLDYQQATQVISARLGKPVIPVIIPLSTYIGSLKEAGLSDVYADLFGEFYEVAISGFNGTVTDTVETVTGHKARTFDDYVAYYFG
jgi:uncharacterized protein YbjT (DUF2867 family)